MVGFFINLTDFDEIFYPGVGGSGGEGLRPPLPRDGPDGTDGMDGRWGAGGGVGVRGGPLGPPPRKSIKFKKSLGNLFFRIRLFLI